ncbi:MAG: acetate uptake transporter, partial [Clostridiales bacterium]|nr:acetate uptake transporter [Clostridiales bacterium]
MEKTYEKKCNVAPLGLFGAGMTTVLLSLQNVGLFELNIMIVAMGIALGGVAQFCAGLLEFKQSNTFGGVAFTLYGLFWISLMLIFITPFDSIQKSPNNSMGFYLLIWGLFTAVFFVGTFKHNRISQIAFGTLMLLFFLLALENFTFEYEISTVFTKIAGVVGIVSGLAAF